MAKRTRWTLLGGALLAAGALAAGVIVVVQSDEPEPAEVVHAYLDAVRKGDVETAMTYVEGSSQLDHGSPILTETAGGDWEILEVSQEDERDKSARVRVRLGVNGREVPVGGDQQSFDLYRDPDRGWRIGQPLAWFAVSGVPLPYVEIGDAREAVSPKPDDRLYLIFPGVHSIYADTAGLVKVSPDRIAAAPGSRHQPPDVSLTEDGLAAADTAMRTYLDDCAAETVLRPDGCPFGVSETVLTDPVDPDTVLRDVTNVAYQMTRYPAEVEPETIGLAFAPEGIATAQVRVTGTGTDNTGASRSFTLDCDLPADRLGVTLDIDGEMMIVDLYTHKAPAEELQVICGRR